MLGVIEKNELAPPATDNVSDVMAAAAGAGFSFAENMDAQARAESEMIYDDIVRETEELVTGLQTRGRAVYDAHSRAPLTAKSVIAVARKLKGEVREEVLSLLGPPVLHYFSPGEQDNNVEHMYVMLKGFRDVNIKFIMNVFTGTKPAMPRKMLFPAMSQSAGHACMSLFPESGKAVVMGESNVWSAQAAVVAECNRFIAGGIGAPSQQSQQRLAVVTARMNLPIDLLALTREVPGAIWDPGTFVNARVRGFLPASSQTAAVMLLSRGGSITALGCKNLRMAQILCKNFAYSVVLKYIDLEHETERRAKDYTSRLIREGRLVMRQTEPGERCDFEIVDVAEPEKEDSADEADDEVRVLEEQVERATATAARVDAAAAMLATAKMPEWQRTKALMAMAWLILQSLTQGAPTTVNVFQEKVVSLVYDRLCKQYIAQAPADVKMLSGGYVQLPHQKKASEVNVKPVARMKVPVVMVPSIRKTAPANKRPSNSMERWMQSIRALGDHQTAVSLMVHLIDGAIGEMRNTPPYATMDLADVVHAARATIVEKITWPTELISQVFARK